MDIPPILNDVFHTLYLCFFFLSFPDLGVCGWKIGIFCFDETVVMARKREKRRPSPEFRVLAAGPSRFPLPSPATTHLEAREVVDSRIRGVLVDKLFKVRLQVAPRQKLPKQEPRGEGLWCGK